MPFKSKKKTADAMMVVPWASLLARVCVEKWPGESKASYLHHPYLFTSLITTQKKSWKSAGMIHSSHIGF